MVLITDIPTKSGVFRAIPSPPMANVDSIASALLTNNTFACVKGFGSVIAAGVILL